MILNFITFFRSKYSCTTGGQNCVLWYSNWGCVGIFVGFVGQYLHAKIVFYLLFGKGDLLHVDVGFGDFSNFSTSKPSPRTSQTQLEYQNHLQFCSPVTQEYSWPKNFKPYWRYLVWPRWDLLCLQNIKSSCENICESIVFRCSNGTGICAAHHVPLPFYFPYRPVEHILVF